MGKAKTERKLASNEASAYLNSLRTGPQKLNLVAESIRGLKVQDALLQLTFSRKRIAKDVKQLLLSAIANAENNHNLDVDRLYVKEATVGKGLVMKRFQPRARGRAFKILKPFSNMTLIVKESEE